MSVRFALDNGKIKEYPTWWTESGEDISDKPYHTKCGLSFKKNPADNACDHLDCAIYAAREEAIFPVAMYCMISIMMILTGWYEERDLPLVIIQSQGFLIVFGALLLLMAISPFRRWLQLREYQNHGTIRGRSVQRIL